MQTLVIAFLVTLACASASHCPIYLTLKNDVNLKDSSVIINWDLECENAPEKLRVYEENPYLSSHISSILEVKPKNYPRKKFDTNYKVASIKIPHKWSNDENSKNFVPRESSNCLNFYVLGFNKTNHVTNFECLKINPQWMSNMRGIWKFPLKHLMIPGTKCSGCYKTLNHSKRKDLSEKNFKQNFNVWQQLVFGIRYLEFSVGYFRSFHGVLNIKGRFYVFSENREVSPIFPMLQDIRRFVDVSQEIVVIEFKDFVYGFHENSMAHEIFIDILEDVFEDVAIVNEQKGTKSFDLTIEQMKRAGKNLLILYNRKDMLDTKFDEHSNDSLSILWPTWERVGIKTTDLTVVKHFLSNVFPSKFRVDKEDGWILDINYIKNTSASIDNASQVNSQIISSLTGVWILKANVVPLDYVFSTNLVEVSQYVNEQKALQTQKHFVIDV